MNYEEQELKDSRLRFRNHMLLLWKKKHKLLLLFRSKLEEKKIQEINQKLLR